MAELPGLPAQPAGLPWPAADWPESRPAHADDAAVAAVLDEAFSARNRASHGETLALLAVQGGRVVAERYAPGNDSATTFISWSMAKSITHALVGVLVGRGRLDPGAPAPVPRWQAPADPRAAITLEHLLRQVDGLDFVEVYEDGQRSDVIDMLFKQGKDDVAAFAESRRLAHRPGSVWNYSSGTSNIVAAIVGRAVGGGREGMQAFLHEALFDPLGMRSATVRFDAAGTFIGSSYVFATARDFARFGLLYLRDGIWAGRRILPEGWVDHARTPTPASDGQYGAHWWLAGHDPGIFAANGFNGQYVVVVPERDLVVVRLGVSTPEQRVPIVLGLRRLIEAFPGTAGPGG